MEKTNDENSKSKALLYHKIRVPNALVRYGLLIAISCYLLGIAVFGFILQNIEVIGIFYLLGFFFECSNLILVKHHNKRNFIISLSVILILIFLSPLIAIQERYFNFALGLLFMSFFSFFRLVVIGGHIVFEHFRIKWQDKWKPRDNDEIKREDSDLPRAVAFIQTIFSVLYGTSLLIGNPYLDMVKFFLLLPTALFIVLRTYATIKDSDYWRYMSSIAMLSIIFFDILAVVFSLSLGFLPPVVFITVFIIPVQFLVFLSVVSITLAFLVIIRVMLLRRYNLPEGTFP